MGIRGTIDRPDGMPFAVLVLPSHDSAGRQFPLGFFAPGFKCDQVTINHWADVTFWIANQTITTLGTADGLAAALRDNIDPEKTDQPALKQSLWTTGPPMDIETAIRAFFSQQD